MKMYQSQLWLTREYKVKQKTVTQIAKEQDVSVQTIQNYLEKYGLIRNKRSWKRG